MKTPVVVTIVAVVILLCATSDIICKEKALQNSQAEISLLRDECYRARAVATMAPKVARTMILPAPGTKMSVLTIPPRDFGTVELYENEISLCPVPHIEKRRITRERWNRIWKCTCPLTCGCWFRRPCTTKACPAEH